MVAVRYEVRGSTAILTLDHPEKRNAITSELLNDLTNGIRAAEVDADVRAVILTHTGNTFCAGADLTGPDMRAEIDSLARIRQSGEQAAQVNRLIAGSSRPIIAAIHGHVRAGGMGFVASCDVVIAGPRATFGLSEVRIGVVAAIISSPVLCRLGDRVAAEWFLRGGPVSAEAAAAAGFITRAVDGETTSVDDAVAEVMGDLRLAAPGALAAAKRLVNRRMLARMDTELEEMLDLSASSFASHEGRTGIESFLSRSTPPWVLDR